MKVAIVHEMLVKLGWAEKVVEELLNIFSDADFYTLLYDEKKVWNIFPKSKIHPICFWLPSQKRYNLLRKQKLCLPKMAESIEVLDFSKYDIVLVSSSWFAHWVLTKPECKTIIYYHAPARYLWDWTHEYRKELWLYKWILGYFFGRYLNKLRQWDYIASRRADILLANSKTTQSRIWKYYRRESKVVFPPIDTKRFQKKINKEKLTLEFPLFWGEENKKNYYIILSALTEFKRLDVAIHNFSSSSDTHLVIIWEWAQRKELEELASWKNNIHFVGAKYGDELVWFVQNSLGLIFPGEEDFWIVPIEVMAAGKPVFALRKWGLTETVIDGVTGWFFEDIEWKDFHKKFQIFHNNNMSWSYKSENCKKQAAHYDKEVFYNKIQSLVEKY